ncbi:MAG: hypothetical protein ACPGXL_03450 [Chitinophagales bacterium]
MDNSQQAQISAIRDIIFGQNMQDYESRFRTVSDEMQKDKTELENSIGQMNNAMVEMMKNMEQRLSAQIKQNHNEVMAEIKRLSTEKTDRALLSQAFAEVAKKIAL